MADKFTLAGNKLTFIAKAFEAGSDNTYRVKIKATVDVTIFFIEGLTHVRRNWITVIIVYVVNS
jgi:hypothetical protein